MTVWLKRLVVVVVAVALFCGCGGSREDSPHDVTSLEREAEAPPKRPVAPLRSSQDAAAHEGHVRPEFVDVAAASGVQFQYFSDAVAGRYFLPEIMGGGVAWWDFDLDGRLDLFFANGSQLDPSGDRGAAPTDGLFRQLERGQMQDVSQVSGCTDAGYGQGVAVGDFDHDGFADLYVANFGPSALLHNLGDGTFENVAIGAQVAGDGWATSVAWCDFNRDRCLDLYVTTYMDVSFKTRKVCQFHGRPAYCGPGNYEGMDDRVYLSNGDGTFREAASELGMVGAHGKGLAVVIADLDDDLRPEVYVGNDMTPNFLFVEQPTSEGTSPKFLERASRQGCATSGTGESEASMGVACADFTGDGRPDLLLTHYYNAKNTLYVNQGRLLFDDESRRWRVAATSWDFLSFGIVPVDYDLNGVMDVIIANGHVLGPEQPPFEMTPQLLRNDGRVFHDLSASAGEYFQRKLLGRGAAAADFDNDGDLDVAISHLDHPAALLENRTARAGQFVGFDLRTRDRVPPIGGRIVAKFGDQVRVAPVVSGGSYLSASDTRLHIGLGDNHEPLRIEVFWPSGHVDRFNNLATDRHWRLVEGEALSTP